MASIAPTFYGRMDAGRRGEGCSQGDGKHRPYILWAYGRRTVRCREREGQNSINWRNSKRKVGNV